MLQSGCVVPAVGGGLCQLSNALYELALKSDCKILERHSHSIRLPEMPVHDATVAWNYIDLRFRPRTRIRMEWQLTDSELIGAFFCEARRDRVEAALTVFESTFRPTLPKLETCDTCDEVDCSRHVKQRGTPNHEVQAFLVDAFWPEFDHYIQLVQRECDWLLVPINGSRWGFRQYAWTNRGFAQLKTVTARTLLRSFQMRRIGPQGAPRQRAMLRTSAEMACAMAERLPSRAGHLVVDQTLLPALWRSGALGGRTFDVLMRRLPMRMLQAELDEVARRWPESVTAADFRASQELLDVEDEAIDRALRIVTPHRKIARVFGDRVVLLDWVIPANTQLQMADMSTIYFPGPVTARKGAFLLREALEKLDIEILWTGAELEGQNFWGRLPNRRLESVRELSNIGIAGIVQPAFLEDRPHALLMGLSADIPVIATEACGLGPSQSVSVFPEADTEALRAALVGIQAAT